MSFLIEFTGLFWVLLVNLIDSCVGNAEAMPGNCTTDAEECKNGLVIPIWLPKTDKITKGEIAGRAIVYSLSTIYLFIGVSIASDRFMSSIEVITSKEKEVEVKKANGEKVTVLVKVWNQTVSDLTLMALGSSAPEIMLAAIEIIGNGFSAGELGPSTIVGSAAFNLFIIIAICVYVIPTGETRRIQHLRVFICTATWSVFAYLWLWMIIKVSSPSVVDVWEGLVTLAFFPIFVIVAYLTDEYKLMFRCCGFSAGTDTSYSNLLGRAAHLEMTPSRTERDTKALNMIPQTDPEIKQYEEHRREFIRIIRDIRHRFPYLDMKAVQEKAEMEVLKHMPKSKFYYRMQTTRRMTGGGRLLSKAKIEKRLSQNEPDDTQNKHSHAEEDPNLTRVYFDPGHYTVMENVGVFPLTVIRDGGDLKKTITVDYKTEDGTAKDGLDYVGTAGTIKFEPGDTHKQFTITIIDDDIFELDEFFLVHLRNLRCEDRTFRGKLTAPSTATVMVIDDDHPGIFTLKERKIEVTENIGNLVISVNRNSGARGTVGLPFHAVEGSAKSGKHFKLGSGELKFEDDETEQFIKIHIVDDEEYEKTESFSIQLDEPYIIKRGSGSGGTAKERQASPPPPSHIDEERMLELGKPRLGDITHVNIMIKESQEFKSVVDKLLKKANVSLVVGTSSWREQFVEAITVSAGDDDDDPDEEAEEKLPSCLDYVMHFLTLFWKVLFALIPPTDYWGGWACFVVSILMIGLLTAVIGDLASSFGCTIGLKDAVTAISFVALGTSVPDTFASKVSAINDKYADSSIGNVTGSNAVNVFLGIGIAWSMAAIYHSAQGNVFYVNPGPLGMSVTVFCVMAFFTVIIMVLRRRKSIGGELGGPFCQKVATSCILVCFWVTYLVISSMVSYCYVKGF